jgi:glycolate oxidase
MASESIGKVVTEIGRRIGKHKIENTLEILTCYAFDATNMSRLPQAVAFPESCEEVRSIVGLCFERGIPVIPRGAGTGFAGGSVPASGGIVVSTERLNRIISIDQGESMAVVQAGVVNSVLQKEAAKFRLMFPPDPSSLEVCTIGGNVAQDAGGPRALKYGVTRDYVLGLEMVTSEGLVVECKGTGLRPKRWDPVRTLLVGGEGTLGVITTARLRLLPQPESFRTALAFFDSTVAAAEAVSRILASGVLPAAVELIDSDTMDCVRGFVSIDIPKGVGCSLLVETEGRPSEAEDAMVAVEKTFAKSRTMGLKVAASDREREDLWRMRRSISPSLARIAPCKMNEDVCVPRSRLPALVEAVGNLAKRYCLRVPTFGHAGDGNLHVNVMLDRRKKDEMARAEAMVNGLFEATLKLGGTISGEHGIGLTKRRFLADQLGTDGLEFQRKIKASFDPAGLVNPGKVISDQ